MVNTPTLAAGVGCVIPRISDIHGGHVLQRQPHAHAEHAVRQANYRPGLRRRSPAVANGLFVVVFPRKTSRAALLDRPAPAAPIALVRLLLASGRRVGAFISCRRAYIHSSRDERIVIPARAERTKVPWKKRHLEHLAQVIPITPEIAEILGELSRVGPQYGDADQWLFPSREASSGHMEEELNAVKGLRRHSGIRFNLHQLRHNMATAVE